MNKPNFKTAETLKRGDKILEGPNAQCHWWTPATVVYVSTRGWYGQVQFVVEIEATGEIVCKSYMPGDSFRVDG